MARGDDLINLIIALADMVGSVAKNMKKILVIIWKNPREVREHPTLMGYDVPEAQIVSVEPLIATEEEAPLPFIEANSAAVSWKELTEESILPSYADGEIVVPHSHFIQALVLAAHDALPQDTFGPVELRASHLTQGRIPSAIYKKKSELINGSE